MLAKTSMQSYGIKCWYICSPHHRQIARALESHITSREVGVADTFSEVAKELQLLRSSLDLSHVTKELQWLVENILSELYNMYVRNLM